MATLIMMSSPSLYKLLKTDAETCKYRLQPDLPLYTEEPLNTPTLRPYNMTVHDHTKFWFTQWVELAYHYPEERERHISDEIWKIMMSYTTKEQGSPAAHYVINNAFRVALCLLLNPDVSDWYVLYDPVTFSETDPPFGEYASKETRSGLPQTTV